MLDLEDFLVSNIWLPLGSITYLLFCTSRYGWGWKNFKEEANEGGGFKVRDGIRVYVSYILPLIVLVIFVLGIKDKILLLVLLKTVVQYDIIIFAAPNMPV